MALVLVVATAVVPAVPGVAIVAVDVVGGVPAGEFAVEMLSAMLFMLSLCPQSLPCLCVFSQSVLWAIVVVPFFESYGEAGCCGNEEKGEI